MNYIHLEEAKKIIHKTTAVFWFRRDLRLQDNAGLFRALKEHDEVVPVFIFDTTILSTLEDKCDRRVDFLHRSLRGLAAEIEKRGSALLILYGVPEEIFKTLTPGHVYANTDYEPYARKRDEKVSAILREKGCAFHSFKDHVIFEKDDVVKEDRSPYTVFTPYSKKWKARLTEADFAPFASEHAGRNFKKIHPLPFPTLADIGFMKTDAFFPEKDINGAIIRNYHLHRDYPALGGTSRAGVHLRFGTLSIRGLVGMARNVNAVWLNELIWREFYHMILWHFPHVEKSAFKPAYNSIEWRNNENEFAAWCEGRTGYPLVDAGMRELNQTGYMHNRVRMVTASFLTKHLLVDYRWGEAYFAQKLLDFDLAANNGGWQWAAGSGCDAAPYFRVFNPALQREKFDRNGDYIRKWVPEAGSADYVPPIVDHDFARKRSLEAYQTSLRGQPFKHATA